MRSHSCCEASSGSHSVHKEAQMSGLRHYSEVSFESFLEGEQYGLYRCDSNSSIFNKGLTRSSNAVDGCDFDDGILRSSSFGDSIYRWSAAIVTRELTSLLDSRIVSVEHRKNVGGLKHEYILATVLFMGQSRPYIRYVRLDIAFQRNSKEIQTHYRMLLRGDSIAGEDTVIITPTPFHTGSVCLYEIYFHHEHAPSIKDLAIMIQAIAALASIYHMCTLMCYWHARMLFEGLARAFCGHTKEGDEHQMRGKFDGFLMVVDEKDRFLLIKLDFLRRASNFYELFTISALLELISSGHEDLLTLREALPSSTVKTSMIQAYVCTLSEYTGKPY